MRFWFEFFWFLMRQDRRSKPWPGDLYFDFFVSWLVLVLVGLGCSLFWFVLVGHGLGWSWLVLVCLGWSWYLLVLIFLGLGWSWLVLVFVGFFFLSQEVAWFFFVPRGCEFPSSHVPKFPISQVPKFPSS